MKRFRKIYELLRKIDSDDAALAAGAFLVAAGIWQIYRPAAFIAVGAALIWWGLMGSRSKTRGKY